MCAALLSQPTGLRWESKTALRGRDNGAESKAWFPLARAKGDTTHTSHDRDWAGTTELIILALRIKSHLLCMLVKFVTRDSRGNGSVLPNLDYSLDEHACTGLVR